MFDIILQFRDLAAGDFDAYPKWVQVQIDKAIYSEENLYAAVDAVELYGFMLGFRAGEQISKELKEGLRK